MALALVERIERIGVNVNIKWPNDLLVDGQKLAGILPRLFFRGGTLRLLRVGVGLNVFNNVPEKKYDAVFIAVAHSCFLKIGVEGIINYCKRNHVIFDFKYLFDFDLRLERL